MSFSLFVRQIKQYIFSIYSSAQNIIKNILFIYICLFLFIYFYCISCETNKQTTTTSTTTKDFIKKALKLGINRAI